MSHKLCLVVIDGWGVSPTSSLLNNVPESVKVDDLHENLVKYDAIANAKTPVMDNLEKTYPTVPLYAHGLAVGLPRGLMGNSEVGHLNLGAGRVVPQDIVRIDLAVEEKKLLKQPALEAAYKAAKENNGRIHFVGMVSDGGVHSHVEHLKALLLEAKAFGIHTAYVHVICDGRDTSPKSATKYISEMMEFMDSNSCGQISTVVGRYYAMDRDKRWERTAVAYKLFTEGCGEYVENPKDLVDKVSERYEAGETDEFLKPILVCKEALLRDSDTVVFFNYRSDRMRQIVSCFISDPFPLSSIPEPPMSPPSNLHVVSMTNYKEGVFDVPVIFPPLKMVNVLAEWLSKKNVAQMHVAETEKHAHVTFFFNGGREVCFEGEDRIVVPSPKVATYDLAPSMSCAEVADKVVESIESSKYPFVMCNFAPPDMVGHSGKYEATLKAVEATDAAIGVIFEACKAHGYLLAVTSDHGNAEKMMDTDGRPHTAHTTAPVPFILASHSVEFAKVQIGALCDVAPTILELMGIEKPEEMTGRSLLVPLKK